MKWISKDPPLYIFPYDCWERETDHKMFMTSIDGWRAGDFDNEVVPYPKKTKHLLFPEKPNDREVTHWMPLPEPPNDMD